MKPEKILGKWIKALESGKLEQGEGSLHCYGRMCVLGVLCDVSKMGKWVAFNGHQKSYHIGINYSTGNIPKELSDKLNMPSVRGYKFPHSLFSKKDLQRMKGNDSNWMPTEITLDFLNDIGFSFQEMAKYLRKYFKENNIKVDYVS